MSRDELAQLLLCYIGTAADIIEFFDSFKDPKVNTDKLLCLAVLCIWNWSLMQFTIIVPAAQNKAMNLNASACEKAKEITNLIFCYKISRSIASKSNKNVTFMLEKQKKII